MFASESPIAWDCGLLNLYKAERGRTQRPDFPALPPRARTDIPSGIVRNDGGDPEAKHSRCLALERDGSRIRDIESRVRRRSLRRIQSSLGDASTQDIAEQACDRRFGLWSKG